MASTDNVGTNQVRITGPMNSCKRNLSRRLRGPITRKLEAHLLVQGSEEIVTPSDQSEGINFVDSFASFVAFSAHPVAIQVRTYAVQYFMDKSMKETVGE